MKLIIYKISASHIILETIKNKICNGEFNSPPSSFVKLKNSYYIVQPYDNRCFDLGWNIIKKQTDCRPRVIFVEKEDVLEKIIIRKFDTVDNHQYLTYSSDEFLEYIEEFVKDVKGIDGLDIYYSYLNDYFLWLDE